LAIVCIAHVAAAELSVGDIAPDFEMAGSDGQTYRLSELLGSGDREVVLAWFPKAFTPG
jgi:peroxiredoxin Q/BCP